MIKAGRRSRNSDLNRKKMSNLCGHCGKSFSSTFNLKKHERNFHNDAKILFNCRNNCGKKFTSKWYEKNHSDTYCIFRNRQKEVPVPPKGNEKNTTDDENDYFFNIKPFLPEDYSYDLETCDSSGIVGCTFNFEVNAIQDCEQWIQKFQDKMLIDFRKMNVHKSKNPVTLMMRKYRCHHTTRNIPAKNPKAYKKHTKCPWQLVISARTNSETQCIDVHVKLKNDHNHRLNCADNAKYRHPGEDVEQEFKKLFEEGMNPEKAYNAYSSKLKNESGNEFFLLRGDRRILPDRQWINNLYAKTASKVYGKANGENMFQILEERVLNYNEKEGTVCAMYLRLTSNDDFIVVIQTEFMKRVCNDNPLSKETLFVDSSGTMDRFGCRVFLLMCNSSAGGLPIAVFVTSNETEKTITSAINLWKKNFLTPDSFYKNGLNGPKIIISDDSASERNSFSAEFPQSSLFLCTFHLLQAVWRNIWNSNYNICDNDRQTIMMYIKQLLYCENSDQLETKFNSLMTSELFKKYSSFKEYLAKLYHRKKEWALCFRKNFITRGQNTNNICEAAMRVMKERILERTKAYTPAQLIDFILVEFNEYYVNKLVDVAHGRPTKYLTAVDYLYKKKATSLRIIKEHDNGVEFDIYNEASKSTYIVNTEYGTCSCADVVGMSRKGKFCKHQWYVCMQKKIDVVTKIPETEEEKKSLMKIALGNELNLPNGWFKPLLSVSPKKKHGNQNQSMPEPEVIQNNDNLADTSVAIENCNNSTNNDRILLQKNNDVDMEEVEKELNEFCSDMRNLIRNDITVLEGLRAFLTNYRKLRTNAAITSALKTFTKYATPKKKSSRLIPVQVTSIVRRKTGYKGRKLVSSGRPPKSSFRPDHCYPVNKKNEPFGLTRGRKAVKIHNLGEAISQNSKLG